MSMQQRLNNLGIPTGLPLEEETRLLKEKEQKLRNEMEAAVLERRKRAEKQKEAPTGEAIERLQRGSPEE